MAVKPWALAPALLLVRPPAHHAALRAEIHPAPGYARTPPAVASLPPSGG